MKSSFSEYIKFRFHKTLSKGTSALLSWLAFIAILFILVSSIFVKITIEDDSTPFTEIIWISLLRVLDPGIIGGDSGNWTFLIVLLLITLAGVFIFSTLIGIVTTSIDNSIASLRKGRSKVFMNNHTLILGWNEKVIAIVTELIIAFNQYKSKYSIVILGNEDKVMMEDKLRDKVGLTGNTSIICRSGVSSEIGDLKITNLNKAKSIIVVPPDKPYADISVIKTVLALFNFSKKNKDYNIISSVEYTEDYKLLKNIGGDKINVILSNEVIAKIIAQTCRQPGLSLVYSEILSFNGKSHYKDITGPWYEEASGDEIYFSTINEVVGKKYDEILLSFNSSTVIGVVDEKKKIVLNPPADFILKQGAQVIVIAEDAEKIDYHPYNHDCVNNEIIENKKTHIEPEKILIINLNRLSKVIINKLDKYLMPGSTIDFFINMDKDFDKEKFKMNALENVDLNFIFGDPTKYNELEKLKLINYDHIVVLSDFINYNIMDADARNLITLLHARSIIQKSKKDITIVSQMMDERNRAVADQAKADDFIISEKIISQYMAQISENKFLYPLFNELFTNEGSEIYFNKISDYVQIGEPTNFYTLVKSASSRNESAIGYRKSASRYDVNNNYGVKMNPDKDEKIIFDSSDQIIVLAKTSK